MRARLLFGFLVFWSINTVLTGQDVNPVPEAADKYLQILVKRPRAGMIFERFYAAWLEQSDADDLKGYLMARTAAAGAKAADHQLLALFHAHRGEDREALAAYEAALRVDSADAAAWVERARLEARSLDFAASLTSLDAAAKQQPEPALSMEISKLRGRALLRLGRNDEALREWKELAAAHAQDEDLAEELIDLLADEGQYEAAIESARALVQKSRDAVARTLRRMRLADILLLADRRDDALKTLQEALAATGADSWIESDVLGRISRVLRMGDDADGLEKLLGGLVKEHPQRVALAWQHTQLLAETGQKEASLASARALLASNPGRRELQEGFLDLLDGLGMIPEAVEQARVLTRQNAEDKELRFRLAALQQRAKDEKGAQETLAGFLAMKGTGEAEHLRVARLMEGWETPPVKPGSPAEQAYARLVELFPASLGAQEARASYLHRVGRRDEALAVWERLGKTAGLEDLLRIVQALTTRLETRPALDLLVMREKEFGTEARILAQMVQLSIANKDTDRAVPWARKRLELARDAEGIDAALKDLALLMREEGKPDRAEKTRIELRTKKTLTIQERCLLAVLIEEAAEAEKLLLEAAEADKLIALGRVVALHQERQDWEKAAQVMESLVALPGARTTARVQRLVDFHRRAQQPEKALKWIAEWKKLSPSAVQPWLDESRVLTELGRAKESLESLRTAARKFPESVEAVSALAVQCMEMNLAEEAERVYLAIYEKTTDITARQRLLGPMALAAQMRSALPRLVEQFQQRQRQNRSSAQPWLALAEIHRATHNDEERRRCLYEASRLRPQDLELLHEIARSEEELGLTQEALRTLAAAAKLDKTTKTRENIARVQIDSGDPDAGWRILFDLAGGDQMDARGIEKIADTIAEKGDWERVTSFLEPLIVKHPKDYRLHYLLGIAMEETGREQDAVRVFMSMLDMHEELPGVQYVGRRVGIREQYAQQNLPPGAEDWLVLPSMMQMAYVHRQKMGQQGRGSRYGSYFGQPGGNGLPQGFIEHAPGVTESPVLALAHVLQIAGLWDAEQRARLAMQLTRAGVTDAALLLEAATESPQMIVTPEMLAAHPGNKALHAVWLAQYRDSGDSDDLPALESAWTLFHTQKNARAFQIAMLAWRVAGEKAPQWMTRLLEMAESLPKAEDQVSFAIISLVTSGMNEQAAASIPKLTLDEERRLADCVLRWYRAPDVKQGHYDLGGISAVLVKTKRWAELVELLAAKLNRKPDKSESGQAISAQANAHYRGHAINIIQPQPYPWPPGLSQVLSQFIRPWMLSSEQGSNADAPLQEQQKTIEAGLRPFIASSKDPGLVFVLRLMCRDREALYEEAAKLAAESSATQEQLLTAAWLAQMSHPDESATLLLRALPRASDADQKAMIENALIYNAGHFIKEEADETKTAPLRAQLKTLLDAKAKKASNQQELYYLAQAMSSLGLIEEAQALEQAAQTASNNIGRSPRRPVPPVANPYSQNHTSRARNNSRVDVASLLKEGKRDLAVLEMVKKTRAVVQQCLSPQNGNGGHYQLHEAIKEFDRHQLTDEVKAAFQKSAEAGWRPRLEWAVLQEHAGPANGISDKAIDEHRAVLAQNPRAQESRVRLAVLLSMKGDFPAALEHWRALPEAVQTLQLPAIMNELSQRSEISVPEPRALSGLLAGWLRGRDASRALSPQVAQNMQQALEYLQRADTYGNISYPSLHVPWRGSGHYSEGRRWKTNEDGTPALDATSSEQREIRRAAHDDLCRAMMQVPELALTAFPAFAGVALYEGKKLDEVEKAALDLLSRLSLPKARYRLQAVAAYSGQNPLTSPQSTFLTPEAIAKPAPSLFAVQRAALRGDKRAIEETLLPLITRVHGTRHAEQLRAYAALLMAQDADFTRAAKAWVSEMNASRGFAASSYNLYSQASYQRGGGVAEIIHLWQQRKIQAPLDELFPLPNASQLRQGYFQLPESCTSYLMALHDRDPALMRNFARRLRDGWIGADAKARREAVVALFVAQKDQRSSYNLGRSLTPQQQAVQYYAQWLQNLLQDVRALPLLELALEDGFDTSPDWLRNVAGRFTNDEVIGMPEDFIRVASALGFLEEAPRFRAYTLSTTDRPYTWLDSMARCVRECWKEDKINALMLSLSKKTPTLGLHLTQALLVKNADTLPYIDGKQVAKLASDQETNGSSSQDEEFVDRALQLVIQRHAADISQLGETGAREFSMTLRHHLQGWPDASRLDPGLARTLAPLLKFESTETLRRLDVVLAAKSWNALREGQAEEFIQQFGAVLQDAALIDPEKAAQTARHVLELLRTSPEQKTALAQDQSGLPTRRWVEQLAHTPALLGLVFEFMEKEGMTRSRNSSHSIANRLEEIAGNDATLPLLLSGTPFVADVTQFRDVPISDDSTPTLLAKLINRLEDSSTSKETVRTHLSKQSATFGTELLLAFLHRGEGDEEHRRSFYNSKRPDDSALTAFILRRASDFAQLQPQTAASLLAMLRARFPDWRQTIESRENLVAALKPLAEADEHHFEEAVVFFTEAESLKKLGMESYEATEHAARLLDRVAQKDKPRALLLLDHTSRLVAAEDQRRAGGSPQPVGEIQVSRWLQRAAQTPEILTAVIERAEKTGATKDAEWIKSLNNGLRSLRRFRNEPMRAVAMMEALHMLDPVASFDPHITPAGSSSEKVQTVLGSFSSDLTGGASNYPGLVELLEKRSPRTFGKTLVLLMSSSKTGQDMIAFAKEFATEIAAASSEQQARIAAFVHHVGWTEQLAPLLPALADELGPEIKDLQERSIAFVRGVQQMTKWEEIEKLYLVSKGMSRDRTYDVVRMPPLFYRPGEYPTSLMELARQLVLVGASDVPLARKTLEHVFDIFNRQFRTNDTGFERPSMDQFLKDVCASPALLMPAVRFISSHPDMRYTSINGVPNLPPLEVLLHSAFPPQVLADGKKITASLAEIGLLTDAANFDPVPLQGSQKSLLELVLWRLQNTPERDEKKALAIEQTTGAVFGHHLLAALFSAKDSPQMARRMGICAREFPHLRPESVGAVLDVFSKFYPELSTQESPSDPQHLLAPLFAKRAADERTWLDSVLAGKKNIPQPYRGMELVTRMEIEKLVPSGKMAEAMVLTRALVRHFEPRTADEVLGGRDEFREALWRTSQMLQREVSRSTQPETILACLLQAAAQVPEVRVVAHQWQVEGYSSIRPGVLFPLWNGKGGRAAPAAVFDQIVRKTAKHGLQGTSTLWLPLLHEMLINLGAEERSELAAWAAREAQTDLAQVARELSLALSLIEATRSLSANPRSPRIIDESHPQASKTFGSAAKQAAALLESKEAGLHSRMALAAFLIATYPGLLDGTVVATWGQTAAQVWHDGAPLTQFEMATLLNAASVLPEGPVWRATRDLVLKRWKERELALSKQRTRWTHSWMHSFLLRFGARSQDQVALKPFFRSLGDHNRQRTLGIFLESGDAASAAQLELLKEAPFNVPPEDMQWWLPPDAKTLASLRTAAGGEYALLAEVLALGANDAETRCLYPQTPLVSHGARLEAFAKKLGALPLPEKMAERVPVLVELARQHPSAALPLLHQFEELAAKLHSTATKKENSDTNIWSSFLAAHAALKAAQGDYSIAVQHLARLLADPNFSRSEYRKKEAVGEYQHILFHCLSRFWSAGKAREPVKILPLAAMSLSKSQSYYEHKFTPGLLQVCLEAWTESLLGHPLPSSRASSLLRASTHPALSCIVGISGAGKNRMNFEQRLQIITRLSARLDMKYGILPFWDSLVERGVFTTEELVGRHAQIFPCLHLFSDSHLRDYGQFILKNASAAKALPILEALQKSAKKNMPTAFVLERAALLIRLKKHAAARSALQVELKETSDLKQREALLKLIPP